MTPSNQPQAIQKGRFSVKTLEAIVDVARKDVQNIEFAIASAKKAGLSTAHWDERLRQTSAVLQVALKEYQEFCEHDAVA